MGEKETAQKEHQQQWAGATASKLDMAQSLTRDLFKHLGTDTVVDIGSPSFSRMGPREKKVTDLNLLANRDRQESLTDTIQQTKDCLLRLQHEHFSRWAPMKVVEWRIALRDGRPPQEHFRDQLQDAMDDELQLLSKARQEIQDQATEAKQLLEKLYAAKHALDKNRRQARDLPGPAGHASMESPRNTQTGWAPHEQNVKNTQQLEETATQFIIRSKRLIEKTALECSKANEKTLMTLDKTTNDLTDMKKQLEDNLNDVEKAIKAAEKELHRAKFRASMQEGPQQPKEKYRTASEILDKLKSVKMELQDDLQCKSVSLKINVQCRKCTPEKTKVPHHKTSAMQYANSTGKVNRSWSTPMFSQAPAGASTTLKAAACATMNS